MRLPVVDVAVSVVQAPDGRVLMAERTARQVAAGFWELPGGKIDPGETAPQAAARELAEEVGIRPDRLVPWIGYEHAFGSKRVRLHIFRVDGWTGAVHGREGQRLAWVDPSMPSVAPVLPSNDRALDALALPALLVIVEPDRRGGPSACLDRLQAALSDGVRLIQARALHMAPDQRVSFGRRVSEIARSHGARVLLAGTALEARRAGADGVHSCARDLRRLTARPSVRLWSASCEGEADLARAAALGATLATLSPGASCAGADGHGLAWLRRIEPSAPVPLYAEGEMTPASPSWPGWINAPKPH